MDSTRSTLVTRLLTEGGERAASELLPLVYEQLRAIAQQRMREERKDHTLQATALVNEAYLRLVGDREVKWNGSTHFFLAAAEAMRRILVEHARARGRVKRGGDGRGRPASRKPLSVLDLAVEQDEDQIVALDDAVRRFEHVDRNAAEVVRLRFYAGLSLEQTAEMMGRSRRTITRDWAFARAWLYQALRGEV